MSEQAAKNQPDAESAVKVHSQVDSESTSGSNPISSELSIDLKSEEREDKVAPKLEKTDEIDVGLTNSLNESALKDSSLSSTLDSYSITGENPNKDVNNKQEQWQCYYIQNDDGDTQLHIAISKTLTEKICFLINIAPHACLLNILNNRGQSALHIAVLTHQPSVVRRLIVAGADPIIMCSGGYTALHLTCRFGDLDCAKALCEPLTPDEQLILKPGKRLPRLPQDLEIRNRDGDMCIHLAAMKGNIELIRYLVHLGADLDARGVGVGNTALHIAITKGYREMAIMLLREFKINPKVRNLDGESAYYLSILNNDAQIAEELEKLGANIAPTAIKCLDEKDDNEGYIKPLAQIGIFKKQSNVAYKLERAGDSGSVSSLIESLNRLSHDEGTVLSDSSNFNTEEIRSEETHDKPWEVDFAQNDDGDTRLHIAIKQKQEQTAFSIINKAPHPCFFNILNNDRESALHLAVLTHQPIIVRRLIVAGGNPITSYLNGNTALHVACAFGDLDCARALTDPLTPDEHSIIKTGKRLLLLPQDLELRNWDGNMCTHVAALQGHIEIVRHLANLGANLAARGGPDGNTILHIAILKEHREMALILLREYKFNLDTRNLDGESAYDFAFQSKESEIIEELLKLGACVSPPP